MYTIIMPRLDWDMSKGTVAKWHKKVGDTLGKGEIIVGIESEKVTYEIEAPDSGVLRKILVKEGAEVPVGQIIGIIAKPNEDISEVEVSETIPEAAGLTVTKESAVEEAREAIVEGIKASPSVRRLAREQGIDLAWIKGTGSGGKITEEDVRRFVEEMKAAPKIREVIPLTGIRKVIAERLSHSTQTVPHSTIIMEIDASNIVKIRREYSTEFEVSYTDILIKAVAKAIEDYPIINSTLDGEQIKVFDEINMGVAVAVEDGLVVPVVHDANRKSLKDIDLTLRELIGHAREGKLTRKELSGGTFTITNLGMFGVDIFTPIINPPETAILGVGRIIEKPTVADNQIVVKPMMNLCLSFDHRIINGAPAAQFLNDVKQVMESPSLLEAILKA